MRTSMVMVGAPGKVQETKMDWRAPSRIGYAVPAGKRSHKAWKRSKSSGRK